MCVCVWRDGCACVGVRREGKSVCMCVVVGVGARVCMCEGVGRCGRGVSGKIILLKVKILKHTVIHYNTMEHCLYCPTHHMVRCIIHLFTYSCSELATQLSAPDIKGVYETQVSLDYRAIVTLGCVCSLNRKFARKVMNGVRVKLLCV